MLFVGAITSSSLLDMLDRPGVDAGLWDFGRDNAQGLFAMVAMRMAAVFTLSVSTVGMRAAYHGPRWISFLGYAVALGLLVASNGQPWLQAAFPAWVLLVSIVILVRSARSPTTPAIVTTARDPLAGDPSGRCPVAASNDGQGGGPTMRHSVGRPR